jgi:hypothetical protein
MARPGEAAATAATAPRPRRYWPVPAPSAWPYRGARNGTFWPPIVRKGPTALKGFTERIIALWARG